MKKLNIVKDNMSMVIDSENQIHVSKPTQNQSKILECENSIEIIEKEIEKITEEIKKNQKEIDNSKGDEIISVLGITLTGLIVGLISKLTGINAVTSFNINPILFSTLITVPISVFTATITTTLRKLNVNNNVKLRNEKRGYKKLLEIKETELRRLKLFDKQFNENYEIVEVVDTDRKTTIEQLKQIKEFYSTNPKSEYEFTAVNLENNNVLTLEKVKNKSKI